MNKFIYSFVLIICMLTSVAAQVQIGPDIPTPEEGEGFGWDVAISAEGNRIAVSAPNADFDYGNVRIYDWDGISWSQIGEPIIGEGWQDHSGRSISLSADGSRIAIGGEENDGFDTQAGHVRVFDWNGDAWSQVGTDIEGIALGDRCGSSVALSSDGGRLAIGSPRNDDNGEKSGHTRIFDWDGNDWIQIGQNINGENEGDYSGITVVISGDGSTVAIGANENDDGASQAGQVRIYTFDGFEWMQLGQDIDGDEVFAYSGQAIAISESGSRVVIGANTDDVGPNSGKLRIYEWTGSQWEQIGSDLVSLQGTDLAGQDAAISADGSRVVMPAYHYSDYPDIWNGHIRIFDWDGSDWVQTGYTIQGPESSDAYGYAVAITANGSKIAFSTVKELVKVFSLTSVSTKAPEPEDLFSVYPNPTDGLLYLEGPAIDHIRIYDILGRVCQQFESTQNSLDLSHLAAGVYYLIIELNGQYELHAILVE